MGRPWWHDSYWEKERKPKRGFHLPGRRFWVWIALLLASLVSVMINRGFHSVWSLWFISFVYYLCRILAFTILVYAGLSWFRVNRYRRFVILLDDVTGPILLPLRRIIPSLGMFDITPLIAMIILYFIPSLLNHLVNFFGL